MTALCSGNLSGKCSVKLSPRHAVVGTRECSVLIRMQIDKTHFADYGF